MIRNNIRRNSCPTETEQFDSHGFVGRKMIPVFGWDFSNFIVTPGVDDINVVVSNDLGSTSTTIGSGTMDGLLGKVCDVYNTLMIGIGDSTTLSYVINGTYGYFILTGANINNSQLAIQNNTTSLWGNPLGIDPDGDSTEGEPPYFFDIIDLSESCKILPLTANEFDCINDEVLFLKPGSGGVLNGTYVGMSEPESVQWSNIPLFDTRPWKLEMSVDTDGLGTSSFATPSTSYATFADLIDVFNTQLASYGSSFRLIGVTNNRILVTDTTFTPLLATDPYFTTNTFNDIIILIEDGVTTSDWLVKQLSVKNVPLVNVTYGIAGQPGLFKGKIGCSAASLPVPMIELGDNYILQHNRQDDYTTFVASSYSSSNYITGGSITNTVPNWANDKLKVAINVPPGSYDTLMNNKPMIFMEVLAHVKKSNYRRKQRKPKWIHSPNLAGPLNRTGTNYGGSPGGAYMTTEWNLTTIDFENQILELEPQLFYWNPPILPKRWVDFVTGGHNLRYQHRQGAQAAPGQYVVNTFKQPIRFRFAYIDPSDNKSVVLGPPSETLYIKPKWGHFVPQDDTYVYDWQIGFNR